MYGQKRRILGGLGVAAGVAIMAAWAVSGKITYFDRDPWLAGWGGGVLNGIATIRYQTQAGQDLADRSTGLRVASPESPWVVNKTLALHGTVPKSTQEFFEQVGMVSPNGTLWAANAMLVAASSDLSTSVIFPVWLPGAVMAAVSVPVLWIGMRKRWRPGICRRCGYDRSTLPNSAPCPECGRGVGGRGVTRDRL